MSTFKGVTSSEFVKMAEKYASKYHYVIVNIDTTTSEWFMTVRMQNSLVSFVIKGKDIINTIENKKKDAIEAEEIHVPIIKSSNENSSITIESDVDGSNDSYVIRGHDETNTDVSKIDVASEEKKETDTKKEKTKNNKTTKKKKPGRPKKK